MNTIVPKNNGVIQPKLRKLNYYQKGLIQSTALPSEAFILSSFQLQQKNLMDKQRPKQYLYGINIFVKCVFDETNGI